MKKILLVIAIMISMNNLAYSYEYAYGEQTTKEQKEKNDLNSDYNSATSNPSNYHRSEGYGITSVN